MPVSTLSDVILLADDIAAAIQAQVESGEDIEATRAYRQELDLGKFTGRKVRVFPKSYTVPNLITRSEALWSCNLIVVTAERFIDPNYPPNDWIDLRVSWVEQKIFNIFSVVEPFRLGKYWCEAADVTVVYDWELLNENKVFWSEVELTYRTVL